MPQFRTSPATAFLIIDFFTMAICSFLAVVIIPENMAAGAQLLMGVLVFGSWLRFYLLD